MTTTAMTRTIDKRWFGLDAIVTGANGAAYLLGAGLLAEHLGADAATYRWLGVALLLYGALVGWYASSGRTAAPGWVIVDANVVWVAASLVVVASGMLDLTGLGATWGVAQALVVAAFAGLQIRSLRAAASR